MRFCDDVGLRAVRVRKEIPGFLWNRVWFAMLREMLHLVDIGAADPLELDSIVQTTLRAFVPVFGPLQMTDLIGHDTLRDISDALYPDSRPTGPRRRPIQQLVRDGRLGVKSGRGFYDDNDERVTELTLKLYEVARRLDGDSSRQGDGDCLGPEVARAHRSPRDCAEQLRAAELRIAGQPAARLERPQLIAEARVARAS